MHVTSKAVAVGDIEIACTVVGEGIPLVVLHGAAGLGSTYMRALHPWADEFQLVYYDQRGSGRTPLGDMHGDWFTNGVEDLDRLSRRARIRRRQHRCPLDRRTSGRSLCGPTPADDVDAGAPQLGPTARPGTDAKVRSGHGRAENPC